MDEDGRRHCGQFVVGLQTQTAVHKPGHSGHVRLEEAVRAQYQPTVAGLASGARLEEQPKNPKP